MTIIFTQRNSITQELNNFIRSTSLTVRLPDTESHFGDKCHEWKWKTFVRQIYFARACRRTHVSTIFISLWVVWRLGFIVSHQIPTLIWFATNDFPFKNSRQSRFHDFIFLCIYVLEINGRQVPLIHNKKRIKKKAHQHYGKKLLLAKEIFSE